mgnify:CR=1 FL=1
MAEPHIPNPTLKQRTAYDLRAKGLTWEAIGAQMGCVSQTARNHVLGAVKRGLQPILSEKMFVRRLSPNAGEPRRVERMKDGEGMFEADKREGAMPAFDPTTFVEMAASAGIPPRIAQALARRIAAAYGGVKGMIKKLTLAEQVTATEAAAQLVLSYIDEVSIEGAGLKDKAIAYGVLVDKGLLLGGKPTQIYDFNLRAKLEVLMPQMLAEARRRGIVMDGTFTKVSETENDDRQPARLDAPAATENGNGNS